MQVLINKGWKKYMDVYCLSNYFINRELSWIEFNKRVFEEALDNSNPLFERLKFISIVSSNLDEFFMVRVGSLLDQIAAGFEKKDPSGLTPKEQLKYISVRVHKLVEEQFNCFNYSLKDALKKEKIYFLRPEELDESQLQYLKEYYVKDIYPVLTPMVVDQSRPFPLILNRSLNIALLLQEDKQDNELIFSTIQVPAVLDRVVEIPCHSGKAFILLEDIIKMNIRSLFSGHSILDASCYRITRNADLTLDEEGAEDLLDAIEESVRQRKWGTAVRLEIEKAMDRRLLEILERELEIYDQQVYKIDGPMDLSFLMKLSQMKDFEQLEYKAIKQELPKELMKGKNMFDVISKDDILLHHPYESFDPIVNLVEQAAVDTKVLAIKQTLYRVSGNSPIIEALVNAAEQGKQVTVLVELKARFDEKNNILWAKRLEEAGCHVIYGLVGLKTHCKILLIVRKEDDGIKRYVHMSTGNYNDVTAKLYTDLGLFTVNPYFGADASALFNMLSGHTQPTALYKISLAPLHLRERFLQLIKREAENSRNGKKAKIIAKMNSLVDQQIIEALFEASCAGVEIHLIVRGICCLRPGIPGVSENIFIRSIVGRFLEHSRIYYFYNNGEEEIYLSSADLMTRNLDRRVELLFPVESKEARNKIKHILELSLSDTVKARILNQDGTYSRIERKGIYTVNSQSIFCRQVFEQNHEKMDDVSLIKEKWIENGFNAVSSTRSEARL